MPTDGRTDRHDEANKHFLQFYGGDYKEGKVYVRRIAQKDEDYRKRVREGKYMLIKWGLYRKD
jgi:hypothetical protein